MATGYFFCPRVAVLLFFLQKIQVFGRDTLSSQTEELYYQKKDGGVCHPLSLACVLSPINFGHNVILLPQPSTMARMAKLNNHPQLAKTHEVHASPLFVGIAAHVFLE